MTRRLSCQRWKFTWTYCKNRNATKYLNKNKKDEEHNEVLIKPKQDKKSEDRKDNSENVTSKKNLSASRTPIEVSAPVEIKKEKQDIINEEE